MVPNFLELTHSTFLLQSSQQDVAPSTHENKQRSKYANHLALVILWLFFLLFKEKNI